MLTALSDASIALSGNRPVNKLMELILELALELIRADRGVLMIDNDGELVARAARAGDDYEVRFARALADKVMAEKVSVLINKVIVEPALDRSFSSMGVRTAMCVPLWDEVDVVG